MFGRAIANLVGFLGGILVILGGVVAGALAFVGGLAHVSAGALGGFLTAGVAIVLGIIVLLLSRPRIFSWAGRRLVIGVLLIGMGVITWLLVGVNLLVVIGALLAVLAGLIFGIEALLAGTLSPRRRLFRRF